MMRLIRQCLLILIGVGALGGLAASPQSQGAATRARHNYVREALRAKKAIVLVVKPSGTPEESEAYGDWADTLNRFATEDGKDFKIVVTTRERFAEMLEEPRVREDYAVLFLADAERGLFYNGKIFEYSAFSTPRLT